MPRYKCCGQRLACCECGVLFLHNPPIFITGMEGMDAAARQQMMGRSQPASGRSSGKNFSIGCSLFHPMKTFLVFF